MLGGFGWVVIINNFAVVYVWLVRREHSSSVPLVGGFFAMVGMGFCPAQLVQRFALVPLFVDVGYFIITSVIGLLMMFLGRKKKTATDTTGPKPE